MRKLPQYLQFADCIALALVVPWNKVIRLEFCYFFVFCVGKIGVTYTHHKFENRDQVWKLELCKISVNKLVISITDFQRQFSRTWFDEDCWFLARMLTSISSSSSEKIEPDALFVLEKIALENRVFNNIISPSKLDWVLLYLSEQTKIHFRFEEKGVHNWSVCAHN